jgi:transposase
VRLRKLGQREIFVPLAHPPGDAQADFGEAMVVIAGVERKAHYLAMDLPQSDDCFVMAFPAETTEAFLEGHNHAFAYFGGVPRRTVLYDNSKIAVAGSWAMGRGSKPEGSPSCKATTCLRRSSDVRARATIRGRWKGWVTGGGNFMVPRPRFTTWELFNAHLLIQSQKRRERKLRDSGRPSGSVSRKTGSECCPCRRGRMKLATSDPRGSTSMSLVRHRTNDYSVPVEWGHLEVLVKGFVHEVVISILGS